MKSYRFTIGPVLDNTLAVAGVLSESMWVLGKIDAKRAMGFHSELGDLGFQMDFGGACIGGDPADWPINVYVDTLQEIIDDVTDAINENCPPYMVFGPNPEDPACLGFWPDWYAIEQDQQDGELLTYSDDRHAVNGEIPAGYSGMYRYVNDHGNTTIGRAVNGESVEVYWDCV